MPNRALIRELTIVDTENKDYNSECDCVKKKKTVNVMIIIIIR
jgi:hypothetical protein